MNNVLRVGNLASKQLPWRGKALNKAGGGDAAVGR
jgi:hypothetical protein